MMGKVVLGLSGGVDSSEAARRLREAGFEVLGVWLDLGFGSPAAAERTVARMARHVYGQAGAEGCLGPL